MEGTAQSTNFEDYVQYLLDVEGEKRTQAEVAAQFGVHLRTLYTWKKKVDWEWIKEKRRARYAPKILEVDDAMFRAAVKGDVAAAKVLYERFDGWTPTTAQKTVHELDESLVDDELKRLMQLRGDTAAAIANTVDAIPGKTLEGADSGEASAAQG